MTVIAAGSSAQLVIAILVVLFNMLLVLKLAPFVDAVDDYLSFLTSLQMLLTLIGGLLLKMDNPIDKTYDPHSMGIALVIVNSLSFVALAFSIVMLHPKVRKRVDEYFEPKEAKSDQSKTKVKPSAQGKKTKLGALLPDSRITKEEHKAFREWE
jgi:hypothetical protein